MKMNRPVVSYYYLMVNLQSNGRFGKLFRHSPENNTDTENIQGATEKKLPLLDELGVKGVFFIISNGVGEYNVFFQTQ